MRKLTVASIGALFSCAALGQDLLQCVNPDVLKGVLAGGRTERELSIVATLPEAMADFAAPSGFAFVGTATYPNSPTASGSIVAYRTDADSESAFAAMLGVFEAEGWVIEEPQTIGRPVFILESNPVSGTICRDRARRSLTVQDLNGRRYVSVNISGQPNSLECNAEDPRRPRGMMSALTDETPTLRLPDGTTAANGSDRISAGGSGSGQNYSTGDQIRIAQSASTFMDGLGAQMLEQGWAVETSWSGTLSKGGRWTKTAGNGFPYWATLELVDIGDGIHDLRFQLMMPPN